METCVCVFGSLVFPICSGKTTPLYRQLTFPVLQLRYRFILLIFRHYQQAYGKFIDDLEHDFEIKRISDFKQTSSISPADQKTVVSFWRVSEGLLKSLGLAKSATLVVP